jgi:hypothetical protein
MRLKGVAKHQAALARHINSRAHEMAKLTLEDAETPLPAGQRKHAYKHLHAAGQEYYWRAARGMMEDLDLGGDDEEHFGHTLRRFTAGLRPRRVRKGLAWLRKAVRGEYPEGRGQLRSAGTKRMAWRAFTQHWTAAPGEVRTTLMSHYAKRKLPKLFAAIRDDYKDAIDESGHDYGPRSAKGHAQFHAAFIRDGGRPGNLTLRRGHGAHVRRIHEAALAGLGYRRFGTDVEHHYHFRPTEGGRPARGYRNSSY